jgi:hypothetical protein
VDWIQPFEDRVQWCNKPTNFTKVKYCGSKIIKSLENVAVRGEKVERARGSAMANSLV